MTDEFVGTREFSRLVKVSESAIQRAMDRGRISFEVINGVRKINKIKGLKDWEENRDVSQDRRDQGKTSTKFAEARIAKVEIDSEYKRLKVEEMNRRLISREEVEEAIFQANTLVRERILSVGARCAAEWAGVTDPVELQNLIESELQSVLENLTNAKFVSK